MCTFGVLGLSCEVLAAPKPSGFHTTTREPKRAHLSFPAFENTTKIQREDTQRETKRAKFWAVRRSRGPAEGGGSGSGGGGGPRRGGSGCRVGRVQTNNTQHNTTTHNNTQQHQPQHNTTKKDWPKMDRPKLAGQIGWPKMDWPKMDWPKSAITFCWSGRLRKSRPSLVNPRGGTSRRYGRSHDRSFRYRSWHHMWPFLQGAVEMVQVQVQVLLLVLLLIMMLMLMLMLIMMLMLQLSGNLEKPVTSRFSVHGPVPYQVIWCVLCSKIVEHKFSNSCLNFATNSR